MANCVVCGKPVDWQEILKKYDRLLSRADAHGYESLTEKECIIAQGEVHPKCVDKLN